MAVWGWRLPFLLTAILGPIGYLVRRAATESPVTTATTFHNLNYLDVEAGCLQSGISIHVDNGRIVEIDLKGRTVMPGLIDCHVHSVSDLSGTQFLPSTQALHAGKRLFRMLRRGFTTVRDAGGADAGFKDAIKQRAIPGPRLFVSGKALSQTGGHGDHRTPFDLTDYCGCVRSSLGFGRLADGVPDFLKAARDELRLGADQIKIVASGGVGSAAGSLNQAQLSDDEVRAVVDEATRAGTYVMAHVYSAAGVKRLLELGVRTIEHGNLIDEDAARAIAARGAYLVLTHIHLLTEQGKHIPLIMKDGYVEKDALDTDLDAQWIAKWFKEEKQPG
jgi:imidazolonepropionase-like amidohydrolase